MKGVLVEEHGAIVLVRDVEVPLEGTAGQEACPLLNAQDFSRGSGARQLGASCAGRRRGPSRGCGAVDFLRNSTGGS